MKIRKENSGGKEQPPTLAEKIAEANTIEELIAILSQAKDRGETLHSVNGKSMDSFIADLHGIQGLVEFKRRDKHNPHSKKDFGSTISVITNKVLKRAVERIIEEEFEPEKEERVA